MKNAFDTALEHILRVDAIVRQLDESIRPQAFRILTEIAQTDDNEISKEDLPIPGLRDFASRYGSTTPAKNVVALAAWLFLHTRRAVIQTRKIRALAEICGLSIPHRPDCTMRYASHHSVRLFEKTSEGLCLSTYGKAYVESHFSQRKMSLEFENLSKD